MTRCPQRSHCWTRPPRAAERQSEHVIPACQQIAVMRADVSAISGSRLKRWRLEIEHIEPTGCGAHGYIGDVEIARRSFQIGVAEQNLDGAKVGARFEQVCGEGEP